MADAPIASDDGAQEVEVIQSATLNRLAISSNGALPPHSDVNTTSTIAALNGNVAVVTNGISSVIITVTGTWVANLVFEGFDGTNWTLTAGLTQPAGGITEALSANGTVLINSGGYSQIRIRASAYTSGTANIFINAGVGVALVEVYNDSGNPLIVAPNTLTKGVQQSIGFTVQELKDAGRTYVTFTADAVAGVTSETLLSFTVNKQGTATATQTNYTITSGKTLRVQAITIGVQAGAAAGEWVRVKLRHNTAGATTTASSLVITAACGTGNATTAGMGEESFPIPDGLEFFGNGTQTIALTHVSSATTNIESITLVGYEY